MRQPSPKWIVPLLVVFLLGCSCTLGKAIRPLPSTQTLLPPGETKEGTGSVGGDPESPPQANPFSTTAVELTSTPSRQPEQPVIQIPLVGQAMTDQAELSGMAWYGNTLLLLPQYPEQMSERGQPGSLFTLNESSILAFLDGESQDPLVPAAISLVAPDLETLIPDYEGFEALGLIGDRVFLTIESGKFGPMMSYLIAGTIDPESMEIRLDPGTLLNIPPQADLINRGEEALVVAGDKLLTLFETNGAGIVPDPVAHHIDPESYAVDTIAFTNVEYRITDAAPAGLDGRFWILNTFFPGDFFIYPETDPIADRYGRGETHSRELAVERLLQMQLGPEGITLADTPPVQLELLDSFQGRNWEGLVELPGRGFLLVTDRHPETILAFVPYP